MNKTYFLIKNKLVPAIYGSASSAVGSTFSASFDGSFSINPNTSKSSDILFMQLALGEGPVYRINPNGPQDIEIDNKYIDDLVNFNTNNTKQEVFAARYRTGTKTQTPLSSFFSELVNPVRFSSPVQLKSGLSSSLDTPAPLKTAVEFFPTSASDDLAPIDSIRFKFVVRDLKSEQNLGPEPAVLSLLALVHDRNEILNINNYIAGNGTIVDSIVEGSMAVEIEVKIPEEFKSSSGYRVSLLKISDDVAEDGYVSEVEAIGFDEIRKEQYSHPSTALAAYAVKSTEFRTDELPTYTSLLKGLIVDVPSNYNQPVLESGEVDWRQVELPSTGGFSPSVNGYRTQKNPSVLLTSSDINIYDGIWDGTYKKDWTENRVWIIRHILVNILGVPESNIDKYNFYSIAQYADAVDPATGNFTGVTGFSDGSFRYKPNGYATEVSSALLGIPEGIQLKERRFVCGISITDSTSAWDLVTALAAGMRAVLSTNGNKIRIIIDRPDTLPVAVFNETNIQENSFKISGTKEEDIPTGVEVSYIDLIDHFRKTSVVLDSSDVVEEDRNKRISVDAIGCTRKSEALRLAKYYLETSRKSRRRVQFTTSYEASDLEVGDIISVSNKLAGLSYGYGGQIFSNSTVGSATINLEYLGYPAITNSVLTSNTNPVALKIFNQRNNKIEYYITNNTASFVSTGNTIVGADLIQIDIQQRLNKSTNSFEANTALSLETAPVSGDIWALGEINPSNIQEDTSGKLFKVEAINIEKDVVSLAATEYSSEVIASIDEAPSYSQGKLIGNQNYVTPPVPVLNLKSIPAKTNEGIVSYNMLISSTTDSTDYSVPVTTFVRYGIIPNIIEVDSQTEV